MKQAKRRTEIADAVLDEDGKIVSVRSPHNKNRRRVAPPAVSR
jgi:hypothetical protein